MENEKGIIKMVKQEKGYGFITTDKGEDLFFHISGLIQPKIEDLRNGMKVEYIMSTNKYGKPTAVGIKVV